MQTCKPVVLYFGVWGSENSQMSDCCTVLCGDAHRFQEAGQLLLLHGLFQIMDAYHIQRVCIDPGISGTVPLI